MSASLRVVRVDFTLDCPDAPALAEFYARLLGWRAEFSADEPGWANVVPPNAETHGFGIACQTVEHYRAPEWPEGDVPQQAHLDLYVEDLVKSVALAEAAGAVKHAVQPSERGSFVVFTDPAGHPFCLCAP